MCSGIDTKLPLLPKYPVRLGEECKRWPGEKVVGKNIAPSRNYGGFEGQLVTVEQSWGVREAASWG